jgi:hypothetical protein
VEPINFSRFAANRDLTWLRKLIYHLRDRDKVETRRKRILDYRQARNWDYN